MDEIGTKSQVCGRLNPKLNCNLLNRNGGASNEGSGAVNQSSGNELVGKHRDYHLGTSILI